jgi:hypothetical protein
MRAHFLVGIREQCAQAEFVKFTQMRDFHALVPNVKSVLGRKTSPFWFGPVYALKILVGAPVERRPP